jgi:hypothetical protein
MVDLPLDIKAGKQQCSLRHWSMDWSQNNKTFYGIEWANKKLRDLAIKRRLVIT